MDLVYDNPPFLLYDDGRWPGLPNAYLAWCAKCYAPDTVRSYAYALKRWLEWCESERIDWKAFPAERVFDYRSSLKAANATVNYAMARLVEFYRFAETKGLPSPVVRLARPRNLLRVRKGAPARPIRLVSPEGLGRFLKGFTNPRDRLIAEVMYFCGLRRSEALGLTRDLLDAPADKGRVRFDARCKGSVRHVTMSAALRDRLAEYARTTTGEHIFSVDGRRIHPDTIEKAFAANRRRVGVKIHCHLLRHLYATHRLPDMDGSTNFLERIGPFRRGISSETGETGQSMERIGDWSGPVWSVGFAPLCAAFSPLGVGIIRLGVASVEG
jgi:integrase